MTKSNSLFIIFVVFFLAVIFANAFNNARQWQGRTFPGFLVYQGLIRSPDGSLKWTGIKAGLRFGEKILKLDNTELTSSQQLLERISRLPPGTPCTYLVQSPGQAPRQLVIATMRFSGSDLASNLLFQFIGLSFLLIGAAAFMLGGADKSRLPFSCFSFSISLWFLTIFDNQTDYVFHLGPLSSVYLAAGITAGSFVHFILTILFRDRSSFKYRLTVGMAYMPALLLFPLKAAIPDSSARWTVLLWNLDLIYVAFSLLFYLVTVTSQLFLPVTPKERARAKILTWGIALSLPLPVAACIVVMIMHVAFPIDLSTFGLLFLPLSILYGMNKHRLLMLTPAIAAEEIFNIIPDPIFILDTEERIASANPAAAKITGSRPEEIHGLRFDQLISYPLDRLMSCPRASSEEQKSIQDLLLNEKEVGQHEFEFLTKNGQRAPVALKTKSIFSKNGEFTGLVCVARDLSEIKRLLEEIALSRASLAQAQKLRQAYDDLEKALRSAKEKAEELQLAQNQLIQAGKLAALGELGAGIAHELNQPLAAIRGFAQLMRDDIKEKLPHRVETLSRIIKATERMSHIVDNIRSFSRQNTFNLAEMSPVKPLEDALELFSIQLKEHGIVANKQIEEELPIVQGDTVLLQQVFINLIANARDALDLLPPASDKTININITANDQHVVYVIEDNGPGVSEEIAGCIFDPFFTTKSVGKGVGLGLSLSYGIIEQHHGQIFHEPVSAGGARFVVQLPRNE